MVTRVPVPRSVMDLHLLGEVDYADAFATPTTAQHGADEWLGVMFEHAHPAVLAIVRFAHTRVGRMDLVAHGVDHPLGWDVLEKSASRVILGSQGGIVTPRVITSTESGRIEVTTVLHYETARARAIWLLGRHVHRAVVRYLLATAVRHG